MNLRDKVEDIISEAIRDFNGRKAPKKLIFQYAENILSLLQPQVSVYDFLISHREIWTAQEWDLIRMKWFKLEEEAYVLYQGEEYCACPKIWYCMKCNKPLPLKDEPNIPEKEPTCVDLNYNCTTAKMAEQIGIKLWQAMVMMKYAELKPKPAEKVEVLPEIEISLEYGNGMALSDKVTKIKVKGDIFDTINALIRVQKGRGK